MIWIKNTRGKPDAMLTFAVISFSVVTLNLLLSTFGTITVFDHTITFQVLDGSIMAVYLGATFSAYVSRRWTDSKYKKEPIIPLEMSQPSTPVEVVKTKTTTNTVVAKKTIPPPVIHPSAPFDDEDTEEILLKEIK